MTKRANRKRGFGRGLPVSVKDVWLVRRAVREGWDIDPSKTDAILADVAACLEDDEPLHLKMAAINTLISIAETNQKRT